MARKYPSELGLWELNTKYQEIEHSEYFNIEGLNDVCGYGPHKFYISIKDPKKSNRLKLKQYSTLAFEVIDSNGTTIYSENAKIQNPLKTFTTVSFNIRETLMKKATKIKDGKGFIYILGTLDDGYSKSGEYNLKYEKSFEIKKHIKNTDDIIFKQNPEIQMGSPIVLDKSSFSKVGGAHSTLEKYIVAEFNKLHTYSGKVEKIEVRGKSDSDSMTQYELLDTVEIKPGLEMLTPSSSKAYSDNWIGDMNSFGSTLRHIHDVWDRSDPDLSSDLTIQYNRDMIPGTLHKWDGDLRWVNTYPADNRRQIYYKVIRKVDDFEDFRFSYNVSGSGEIRILSSKHLDKLIDGNTIVSASYDDDIEVLYEHYFTHDNPNLFNFHVPRINGVPIDDSLELNLNSSTGSQMYHQDFTVDSASYFALYWGPAPPSSGSQATASFSNMSLKQRFVSGSSPGSYHQRIPIRGGAHREEDYKFRYVYLNPDGISAYNISSNDVLSSTSSLDSFKHEGIAIERGLGDGPGTTTYGVSKSFAGRYTFIGTASAQPFHQAIGIIGEASDNNNTSDIAQQTDRMCLPGYTTPSIGGYSVGDKAVIGGLFTAVASGASSAVGIAVRADQDDDVTKQWAARFEKGNVFISDDLLIEGNITAQNYIVSSSTTYVTTSYSAGNSTFGDTGDDVHRFTGSVNITGSLQINTNDPVSGESYITINNSADGVSGNIDSKASIVFRHNDIRSGKIVSGRDGNFSSVGDGAGLASRDGNLQFHVMKNNNMYEYVRITNDGYVGIGTSYPTETLQVEGNISGSNHLYLGNNSVGTHPGIHLINDHASAGQGVVSFESGSDKILIAGKLKSSTSNDMTLMFYTGSDSSGDGQIEFDFSQDKPTLLIDGAISASGNYYLKQNEEIYFNSPSVAPFIGYTSTGDGYMQYKSLNSHVFWHGSDAGEGVGIGGLPAQSINGLTVAGDISASGDLWCGRDIILSDIGSDQPSLVFYPSNGNDDGGRGIIAWTPDTGAGTTGIRINKSILSAHTVSHLQISSSGNLTADARILIGEEGPTNDMLHVGGNIHATSHITTNSHITASGNISGSITSNLTMGGNIIAKTYRTEPLMAYKALPADNTWYYISTGVHHESTLAGAYNTNPNIVLTTTAMCDTKFKNIKLTWYNAVNNVTSIKLRLRKWDGTGLADADANWETVGTEWTVTSGNIADGDRSYHAPSDWTISAGDIWGIQSNVDVATGVVIVLYKGGMTLEEDWNNQVSS